MSESTDVQREDAAFHKRLVQAIADPGTWTPRGDNYEESIPSWSARAVMLLLSDLRVECNSTYKDPIGGFHSCTSRPFHAGLCEDDTFYWPPPERHIGRHFAGGES